MKVYIFLCSILLAVLSSCSNDDSVTTTEPINSQEIKALIELNFIPTIENYFSKDRGSNTYRSSTLSGNWQHEFDEEGRLIKSELFEKYPERILVMLVFSDYDMVANKVNLLVTRFNYFSLTVFAPEILVLNFHENLTLKSITHQFEDGMDESIVLQEMDEKKRITLLSWSIMDEIIGYEYDEIIGYQYNEAGNISKYSVYDANMTLKSSVDYTYTESGDLNSYHFENVGGSFSDAEYFYRSDNTLERMEESFNLNSEEIGNAVSIYTEDEAYKTKTTNYENGTREVITYDGELYIEEHFNSNLILIKVYKYKFIEIKGRYWIREFEQYDEFGNLEYTEYYDEDGNLTDTVYA